MKKILATLTLVSLFAVAAVAQTYSPVQVFKATTVIPIAAQSATNFTAPGLLIDMRAQNSASVQVTTKADDTTTDAITLYFRRSVDGVKYDTGAFSIAVAQSGGTEKTFNTNVLAQGVGYLYLTAVSNAAATANITNCIVKYGYKINNP